MKKQSKQKRQPLQPDTAKPINIHIYTYCLANYGNIGEGNFLNSGNLAGRDIHNSGNIALGNSQIQTATGKGNSQSIGTEQRLFTLLQEVQTLKAELAQLKLQLQDRTKEYLTK